MVGGQIRTLRNIILVIITITDQLNFRCSSSRNANSYSKPPIYATLGKQTILSHISYILEEFALTSIFWTRKSVLHIRLSIILDVYCTWFGASSRATDLNARSFSPSRKASVLKSGSPPQKGSRLENVGVAHQRGSRWGRAARSRVANAHIKDA